MRKEGYFWCRVGDKWFIAQYIRNQWHRAEFYPGGYAISACEDDDFDEIDGREIKNPNLK